MPTKATLVRDDIAQIIEAVKDHAIGCHCYFDRAELDPAERYLIMDGLDEVIGAGHTRAAAWIDAHNELGL